MLPKITRQIWDLSLILLSRILSLGCARWKFVQGQRTERKSAFGTKRRTRISANFLPNNTRIPNIFYCMCHEILHPTQVIMAAYRHKISSNTLNDIIAWIIRESQGCVVDFVLSQTSTLT